MSRETGWRRMAPADLPAVMAIAAVVHPDYPEDEPVFAERLRLAPEGCHVLAGEGGALQGYLVSHPWPAGAVPALNSLLGAIPPGTVNWYIHDLALLPSSDRSPGIDVAVRRAIPLGGTVRVELAAPGNVVWEAELTRAGWQALGAHDGAALRAVPRQLRVFCAQP